MFFESIHQDLKVDTRVDFQVDRYRFPSRPVSISKGCAIAAARRCARAQQAAKNFAESAADARSWFPGAAARVRGHAGGEKKARRLAGRGAGHRHGRLARADVLPAILSLYNRRH